MKRIPINCLHSLCSNPAKVGYYWALSKPESLTKTKYNSPSKTRKYTLKRMTQKELDRPPQGLYTQNMCETEKWNF